MVHLYKFIRRGIRSMIRCKRRNRILIQKEEFNFIDEAEQSNHTASDCNNDNGDEMTLAIAAARVVKDFLLETKVDWSCQLPDKNHKIWE